MLLAAVIGNSHTELGLLEMEWQVDAADQSGGVVDQWRVSTDAHRTSDEWAVLVRGLLGEYVEAVSGVAVCAMVPSALTQWRTMLSTHFGQLKLVIVEPGVRTGLSILTDNPREVGADRIVNALAVSQLFSGAAIVVDFGTATVFDVVNSDGAYIGGAIASGIEISLEALERHGAQLRTVELVRPRSAIARNTVEALQSGMLFGAAAQVDGLVSRMLTELDADPAGVQVVATGRLAPLVRNECRSITAHLPWLTLAGLRMVYQRNC